MTLLRFAAPLACLFVAHAALAQPAPMLLRGTIQSFDGKTLVIQAADGSTTTLPFSDKSRLAAVEARTLAQIKPTDFVGITSVPAADGNLLAEEVHIIPVAGLGEGQYPWDHHPDTAMAAPGGRMTNGMVRALQPKPGSMTNGTVTGGGKWQLNVSYHGAQMQDGKCVGHAVPGGQGCAGVAIVEITPSTPIVAIVPATPTDVKPGLAVVATVMADAAGKPMLLSTVVEKNGVKPEF